MHESRPAATVPASAPPSPVNDVLISVVIACRGEVADTLEELLLSLTAQDYSGWWELLIADNGISTASRDLIARLAPRFPRLSVIDAAQRRGKGHAVNSAVAAAQGSHLVMLDCDDVVSGDYLRHMAAALADHDFVGARLDSAELNPGWARARRVPLQESSLEILHNYRPAVVGAGMAVSRAAFEAVGGFDPALLTQQDIDLSWRLDGAGYTAHFVPDAVVLYRYRQDVRGIFAQERRYGRGEVALYLKHSTQGMRPHPLRWVVRSWLDLALALPRIGTKAGRARAATVLGNMLGRVEASVRYRVLYI